MKKHYHKLSSKGQGIFWMISVCFIVSVMVSIVRYISKDVPTPQIVMMRNFFGLILFLPAILKNRSQIMQTSHLKLHIHRGTVGVISMMLWFHTITLIPLAEAISITFIVPIITTIMAAIFLKEKADKKIWIALILGFSGVIIIMKPGFGHFQIAYIFSLIATFLWAWSNILVKMMTKTEKPQTITFYVLFISVILSIPIAAPFLKPINLENFIWLFILGCLANLSHTSMSIAYSKADLSEFQPFDFTRLIFVSIIAYVVFDETISLSMIIGALLIFFSTFYLLPSAKKEKKTFLSKIFSKKSESAQNQIGIDM